MNIKWGTSRSPETIARHVAFVGSRVEGGERGFGNCKSMGMVLDGKLIGAAIFHNWSPEAGVIEVTGAGDSPRWLSRPILLELFSYIFVTTGCQLAVFRVAETNVKENGRGIQRILKAYGFKEYRIERLRGRNADELVYTLTDDDWRSNGFHKSFDVSRDQSEPMAA